MEKLYVDLIGSYVIRKNGNEENLNLKYVTMIHPVIGWLKIMQY